MRSFVPIAAIIVIASLLAGCSRQGCAYYGNADAGEQCVVVGPAPTGGGH